MIETTYPLPKPEPVWIPLHSLHFPERAFVLGYQTPFGPTGWRFVAQSTTTIIDLDTGKVTFEHPAAGVIDAAWRDA